MNQEVLKAYESLIPKDQFIIDALILTITDKDQSTRKCVDEIIKMNKNPVRGALKPNTQDN